jgi:hypothetical protein
LNRDDIIDKDYDDETWVDSRGPRGGRSCPANCNDKDDGEGEEAVRQGLGKGRKQRMGQGQERGKGRGKGRGEGRGRGRHWRKSRRMGRGMVKRKVLLNKPQGEMISHMQLLWCCTRECMR